MSVLLLILCLFAAGVHASQVAVVSASNLTLHRVSAACNYDGPNSAGVQCVMHICEKLTHLAVARPPCCNASAIDMPSVKCEANLRFGDWPWVPLANTEWSDCITERAGPHCGLIDVINEAHQSILNELNSLRNGATDDNAALLIKIDALIADNGKLTRQLQQIANETVGIRVVVQMMGNATGWLMGVAREPMEKGVAMASSVIGIGHSLIWIGISMAILFVLSLVWFCLGKRAVLSVLWSPLWIPVWAAHWVCDAGFWLVGCVDWMRPNPPMKRINLSAVVPLVAAVSPRPAPLPVVVVAAQPVVSPLPHRHFLRSHRKYTAEQEKLFASLR